MSTSGAKANTSGRLLEETVTRTICGWLPDIKILLAKDRANEDPPLLLRHVPYRSIYGTPSKTEFVLVLPDRSIRIECKWQAVSGSVDEKYPYMFLNMSTVIEIFSNKKKLDTFIKTLEIENYKQASL